MLAQGLLDLFFDAAPHLESFFHFSELSSKVAFAKTAFALSESLSLLHCSKACHKELCHLTPTPQCLPIFHLILGGRSESLPSDTKKLQNIILK